MIPRPTYKWRDLSIVPHGNVVQEGTDAVGQMIYNMFNISPGEILFGPEIGCDIEALIMEPIDEITAQMILMVLLRCMQARDPRVVVNPHLSSVTPNEDENRYDIELVVNIIGEEGEFSISLAIDRPETD